MAMTKNELINKVSDSSGLPRKDVKTLLEALGEVTTSSILAGERVQLPGLATFEVVERAARSGRNPATGEEMTIPAGKAVKVSASTALKNTVKAA